MISALLRQMTVSLNKWRTYFQRVFGVLKIKRKCMFYALRLRREFLALETAFSQGISREESFSMSPTDDVSITPLSFGAQ